MISTFEILIIVASVVCAFGAAVLAAVIEAVDETTLVKAESLAEKSPKRARALVELVSDRVNVEVRLTFVAVSLQLAAAITGASFIQRTIESSWRWLVLILLGLLLILVTETIPKSIGYARDDAVALGFAQPTLALSKFWPVRLLSRILLFLTDMVVPGRATKYTAVDLPEEIVAIADAAVEEEIIEPGERDLIESVIEFGDTVVSEVMIPRTDMNVVEASMTGEQALELASGYGNSRVPVVGEDADDIVGIVYVKDLIKAELAGSIGSSAGSLARDARFVPETNSIAPLLKQMQMNQFHLAIAVDEYGGVAGLVTLEDLIEEIVGEIVDEYDTEEPMVERSGPGRFRTDARISIDEFNEVSGFELAEGEWETVGGLVFDMFGRVPKVGESATNQGYKLSIERVQGHRISRVLIERVLGEVGE